MFTPEYLWASINGYCTAKEQGDQRASFYATGTSCTGTANNEYTETNYQYSIELPTVRNSNVDVIVYDGTYNEANSPANDFNPGGNNQTDMKTTYTLFQPDPTPLDDFDNPEMTGVTDGACTSTGAGQKGEKTFSPSSSTEGGYTFNPGSTFMTSSSSWWLLCRIPTSAPGGRYILRVTNQGTGSTLEKTAGSEQLRDRRHAHAATHLRRPHGHDLPEGLRQRVPVGARRGDELDRELLPVRDRQGARRQEGGRHAVGPRRGRSDPQDPETDGQQHLGRPDVQLELDGGRVAAATCRRSRCRPTTSTTSS